MRSNVRSILILMTLALLSSVASGCATKPKDRLYTLLCFNTTADNGDITLKNSRPKGVTDVQSATFAAAQNPAQPGTAHSTSTSSRYEVKITQAVTGDVLADFEIPINGRYGDAHWGDYTGRCDLVWGPGGGIQNYLSPVGPRRSLSSVSIDQPVGYLIVAKPTTTGQVVRTRIRSTASPSSPHHGSSREMVMNQLFKVLVATMMVATTGCATINKLINDPQGWSAVPPPEVSVHGNPRQVNVDVSVRPYEMVLQQSTHAPVIYAYVGNWQKKDIPGNHNWTAIGGSDLWFSLTSSGGPRQYSEPSMGIPSRSI